MIWLLLACSGDDPGTSPYNADTDGDGTVDFDDCAPEDPAIHPLATEVCDGIDNDCDGVSDGSSAADVVTWYADYDGDGYGADDGAVQVSCDQPSGFSAERGDCDDTDPTVTPATGWYPDVDGDGYGDESGVIYACEQPANIYIQEGGDCFDGNAEVHPGADEYCDGVDTDCDGELDEADALDATQYYVDDDGDGYGGEDSAIGSCVELTGYGTEGGDCDDADVDSYPGSTHREVPFDGVDTDCDGNDFCTDLDCDGRPDVVIPVQYDGSSYAADSWVYFGKGDYLTDTARRALPTFYGQSVVAEDLDGDGYPDLVFNSYRDDSGYEAPSRIYWGSDGGPRDSSYTDLEVYGTQHVLAEDLDADGYTDLAFSSYYDGDYVTVSAVYWGPDFAEDERTEIPTEGAIRMTTGDVDGDGNDDLVVCQYRDTSSYSTSSQIVYGPDFTVADEIASIGCRDAIVRDLNGDGFEDIVFASYYGGSSYSTSSYVYWGYDGGPSSAYRVSLPTTGAADVEVGDVNGDGWDDIVFAGYRAGTSTSSTTYVYTYYGSSLGFSSQVVDSITIQYVWDIELSDFDSDGWLDLLTPVYYTGSSYSTTSYLWWGSEDGWTSDARTDFETFGSTSCAVGDMDDDGEVDFVFGAYYAGSWASES